MATTTHFGILTELDGTPLLSLITRVEGPRTRRETQDVYFLRRNPNAPRAFRLVKAGSEEPYDVDLESGTCDCKGHLAHGHCKHVRVMGELEADGMLILVR